MNAPASIAAPSSPSSGLRRVLAAGAVLAAAALLAYALLGAPAASVATPAPALPIRALACEVAQEQRLAHALDAERRAQAKIARYAYAPAEGLAALGLLALAEDCYAAGDDDRAQLRVSRRAAAWRARLERDYRAALLRFEHARAAADSARAAGFLLALLAGESGPFIARLRAVHNAAELGSAREEP